MEMANPENPSTSTPAKDLWDILRSLAPFISSVLVPLVIAWVGNNYNASIKESENRVRYVELAIAQLVTTPTPETQALREWAVEVLNVLSPVKLSPEAQAQLREHRFSVGISVSGTSTSEGRATGSIEVGK